MRLALLAAIGAVLSIAAAQAEDLVATRPGVMCHSAAALAKLTLPGGDSRTHLPNPSAADQKLAESGGCSDILLGQHVTVLQAFHNTSIVRDRVAGNATLVVPNIDFEPADATGPRPLSTEPDGAAIPAGYRVAQRLPIGGPGSNALVVLIDRRLTPDLRKAMWHHSAYVSDALDDTDPRQAEFKLHPVLDAQLRLVSPDGNVLDELKTSYPLAEVETAPIRGLPFPVFQFSVDESAGFGGFSGPETLLLTPTSTQLRPMDFVSDKDGTADTLGLPDTLHAGWVIVPGRQAGVDEIEVADCPGGDDGHLQLYTYRFRDGRWHQAERTGDACGDLEVMPPRSAFP
jgi:hypothetical protein